MKKRIKRISIIAGIMACFFIPAVSVYATDDPIEVINNLNSFIFAVIRAIGIIILGMGIVQVGLSVKSHDPSQRATAFLTIAGGVIITFAREILNLITGS